MDNSHVDLLITGCTVVTMDQERQLIEEGVIGVRDDRIAFVLPGEELPPALEAVEEINAEGMVAIPGLINAHSHLAMTLFRGFAEDLALQDWLESVWEYELTVLSEESVRIGSKLALAEMIRGGVTTAHDMYWHYNATMDLARDVGFRLLIGSPITEVGGGSVDELIQEATDTLARAQELETVHPVIQAHSIYTTTPALMEAVRALLEDYPVPFTTHASENQREVEEVQEQFGVTPIVQLEDYGLLGERTVLAHCVQVTEEDLGILSESGTHVVHCPESNLKLGSGIAPIAGMVDRGINVCIGTDGPASNNDLDLLGEMTLVPMLQKGVNQDPRLIPTEKVLEMATIGGARAYGLEDRLGSIESGKQADLVLIDFDKPHLKPCHDVYANLIYAANKFDVDTVVINGKIQLQGGVLTGFDEEELLEEAGKVSDIFKRANPDEE